MVDCIHLIDLEGIKERARTAKEFGWGAVPHYVSHAYEDMPALLDHIDKLEEKIQKKHNDMFALSFAAWQAVNDHDLRCEDSNNKLHELEEVLRRLLENETP